MKDTELKSKRDSDLYDEYVKGLRERTFASLREAADHARRQKASQYYISARTASLLIGKIQNNVSLLDLNENSRRRAWKLYEEYNKYMKENPDTKLSREIIMEDIVESQAPEYYLSISRATHIIIDEMRRRRARARMRMRR